MPSADEFLCMHVLESVHPQDVVFLYQRKWFLEGPETHPDILRGGHRSQYQFKNAIKSGGTVSCFITWAK